jgi:dTDP-4-dehydrorhamnose reductase
MTRVLVLGGGGMLGHKLCQALGPRFETFATFRSSPPKIDSVFGRTRALLDVDAHRFETVADSFRIAQPDVVINAIGIVKQLPEANVPAKSIELNALFPHLVDELCRSAGSRLIHVSTDCVFSGAQGNYTEADPPDADDLYARTKLLGEIVESSAALTLRTSIVGRELRTRHGLVEWFLAQAGRRVQGYAEAIFSGLTTSALSELIAQVIALKLDMRGLWHVSTEPVSKYQLLFWLDAAFGTGTTIDRDLTVRYDRSLDSTRFWEATGLKRPTWEAMIEGMRTDQTPYQKFPEPTGAGTSDA